MNNNKLKEIVIKNCRCQYFHAIIDINSHNFNNILLVEKWYGNILIYDLVYKIPHIAKTLRMIFNKVVRYIRKCNRTNYLELFYSDAKYDSIFNRVRYLTMSQSNISDLYSHKWS